MNDRHARIAARAVALGIVVVAALLRLDAFVGKYGPLDHPAWARVTTERMAPLARQLRPAGLEWTRVTDPFVGGDPINYLAYAREMESFYQPHVREPVFLVLTRLALWSLDGQDIAVGFASMAGSVLAVLATYLLGAALHSRVTGLIASLLLAIEFDAIVWAPDGWRDDTFAAAVLLAAWSLLRLHHGPSFGRAIVAGMLCGLACLTRITALSFVLPAIAWLVMAAAPADRRAAYRTAGLALLIAGAVVAPYLISCAMATGDPFFALNYHTVYYRYAEGQDTSQPMSAAEYLRTKLRSHPIGTLDTGFFGLFVHPFATKWSGFNQWTPGFADVARWASVVGLALLPFGRAGRLLLVIVITCLVPYAFTWNVGGGGGWRFTLPAYPIFIIAAAYAAVSVTDLAVAAAHGLRPVGREVVARIARRASAIAAVALVGTAMYFGLPWLVVNEAIAAGEATSVEAGARDLLFFRGGWSARHQDGITIRVSTGDRSTIQVPLPARRDYDLVVRLDPVSPESQQRVSVLLNRQLVGLLRLAWNPERVGSYRLRLPRDAVQAGGNEIVIVAEPTVPAASAGPRFAWLEPDERLGVRLWYIRVLPSSPAR